MKSLPLVLVLAAVIVGQATAQAPDGPASSGAPTASTATEASYSAAGLYDLANSYARAGKPGMAVLNYERAALLSPNDADIQTNLQYVRSSAHIPAQAQSRLDKVAHLASPTTVALVGLLGVLGLGASLAASMVFSKRRLLGIGGSCLGLAAIGFTVCNALFWQPRLHQAVVIAPNTQIRATPVPMGDPLQQLSEAETVTVTAEHEEYALVRSVSGRRGWVARADIADVVPMKPAR